MDGLTALILFVSFLVWFMREDIGQWIDRKRAHKRKGSDRDAS
jgi:uncharacterized membrane protein